MQYTYDQNGFLASAQDSLGESVSSAYLSNGRVQSVTDGSGSLNVVFTDAGVLQSQSDANGNAFTSVENLDGSFTYTDRTGNVTTHTRDADGRLTRVDLPGGSDVELTYDGDGNLNIIAAPLGNVTTYAVRFHQSSHRF